MADETLYHTKDKQAEEEQVQLTEKGKQEQLDRYMDEAGLKQPVLMTQEEKEVLGFLSNLHREAYDARPDQDWELRYKQWRAVTRWKSDGTANINLPIEYSVLENFLADFFSQRPVVQLDPTNQSDVHKTKLYRHLWDYVWTESDTEEEAMALGLHSGIYGIGWWYEGVMKDVSVKYKPTKVRKDGKVESEVVQEERSWLGGFAIDPRFVWVDPMHRYEDAKYIFWQEIDLSYDDVLNLKNDPNYDADAVLSFMKHYQPKEGNQEDMTYRTFNTVEEGYYAEQEKYSLMHYFDKENGMYIVTDDEFQYILRRGALPFPHGELPITPLALFPNYETIYGRSICELLESTKYERNVIRNMILDYIHHSGTVHLATGEGVQVEDVQNISGTINHIEFKGDLSQFQYIKPPAMDGNLFSVDEMLRQDATWITGIDVNSLIGSDTKTAFEAKLQEQTKLKRVYRSLRMMDFFWTKVGRQRLANIQFFMPYTTGKRILGKKMGEYRTISVKDAQLVEKTVYDTEKKEGVQMQDVEDKQGSVALLELDPNTIKNSLDIMVTTPSTTPILKELQKQELEDMFQMLLQAAQTPQGQELLQRFKLDKWMEEMFREKGYDHMMFFDEEDNSTEKKDLMQEVMGELPTPPQTGQESTPINNPLQNRQQLQQQVQSPAIT